MLNRQTKRAYQHPIQLAMKLAARKLDRYYSKTDDSAVYRIAMSAYLLCQSFLLCFNILSVLHPGLKLEYFRKHDWQEEWVDVAENLVREEYISNYENKMGEPEPTRSVDASDEAIVGLLLTFFSPARYPAYGRPPSTRTSPTLRISPSARRPLLSSMNLTIICVFLLKTLATHLSGGSISEGCIRTSHGWLGTI